MIKQFKNGVLLHKHLSYTCNLPSKSHKTEKNESLKSFQRSKNNQNQRVSISSFDGPSQSDAVAVKFCLLLNTRDLYKSDL